MTGGASGGASPSQTPPARQATGGFGAWQNDKRINGLWSINQNRNSWVSVAGVGWKRLANNSDSAVVALTVLASHARQTQAPTYYRDEADGLIHEIYVW